MSILKDDYLNNQKVQQFDKLHSGHPVQIVNKEELENPEQWKQML